MLATLPSQKMMTWTHLSVKQNKSTASSGCSFYYRVLASRRVYKTAPYCISWSYPLPPFISVCRLSFRLHDAAPLFAKPRQSPELNMQWLQRWSYRPPHLSIAISLFPVLTHLFLSIFAFPHRLFTQSSRATGALRGNTGPCQRIHWICCTIDPLEASWGWEWDKGGCGGLEVRKGQKNRDGGLMWRAGNCIRGIWLKITRQSLNWNGSCSNLLPPHQSPNAVEWAKWDTATIDISVFFSSLFISSHTKN